MSSTLQQYGFTRSRKRVRDERQIGYHRHPLAKLCRRETAIAMLVAGTSLGRDVDVCGLIADLAGLPRPLLKTDLRYEMLRAVIKPPHEVSLPRGRGRSIRVERTIGGYLLSSSIRLVGGKGWYTIVRESGSKRINEITKYTRYIIDVEMQRVGGGMAYKYSWSERREMRREIGVNGKVGRVMFMPFGVWGHSVWRLERRARKTLQFCRWGESRLAYRDVSWLLDADSHF